MKHGIKFLLLLALMFAGCSSMQSAMAPGSSIMDLGDLKIVNQGTVKLHPSAIEWQLGLGFSWSNNAPDVVTIKPAVRWVTTLSTERIQSVSFHINDTVIEGTLLNSGLGESTFSITMDEFLQLADAQQVTMRVTQYDKVKQDTFGRAEENPFISAKMDEFLEKIERVRQASGS